MKESKDTKVKRITFFSKEAVECPVCEASFHKEELLSGSGRLIAGNLTDEMRRLYEPSQKYGAIFPLIYPVTVCPVCYYASFGKDFLEQSSEPETIESVRSEKGKRLSSTSLIFKKLDFTETRDLEEGAASYFLAIMCYDHSKKGFSPTIKQAISALRAAWLFEELHRKDTGQNYDYLAQLFYRKALFFYHQSLVKEQTGKESMGSVAHIGPDVDKNYGYDGVLYLTGILEYKYGSKKNPQKRLERLDNVRKIIARVHGMGRASKNRPSAILEKAKDVHKMIGDEIKSLQGEAAGE